MLKIVNERLLFDDQNIFWIMQYHMQVPYTKINIPNLKLVISDDPYRYIYISKQFFPILEIHFVFLPNTGFNGIKTTWYELYTC